MTPGAKASQNQTGNRPPIFVLAKQGITVNDKLPIEGVATSQKLSFPPTLQVRVGSASDVQLGMPQNGDCRFVFTGNPKVMG